MLTRPDEELDSRRIILLRVSKGQNPEILLGFEGGRYTLPQVQIGRWQRVAEQLAAAVKLMWDLDVVSVCSLAPDTVEAECERFTYEVVEPRRPEDEAPRGKRWMATEALADVLFKERNDFQAVQLAVMQCIGDGEGQSRGRFARLGWFQELEQWVQEEIAPHGLHLSGAIRQLNACPAFSLIRFETDGPAIWFKAVGIPNRREYALTIALARLFPSFLPEIIATRPAWDGWLALEAPGSLLCDSSSISQWQAVADDLAKMQIDSISASQSLLGHGARDLRISALANLVQPFLQSMSELMERQTQVPPPKLPPAQLRVLAIRLQDALRVLDEIRLPDSLGHMDFNPGNILGSPAGSVFLDWAEAFVGHPFLTFEYFRGHFQRAFGESPLRQATFIDRYLSPWRAFASEGDLRRSLDVAHVVAVFANAVGNDVWTAPGKLQEPRVAGYLRSLTRRMEREAHSLAERSARCPK